MLNLLRCYHKHIVNAGRKVIYASIVSHAMFVVDRYQRNPSAARTNSLIKAVKALASGETFYTKNDYPFLWANIRNIQGVAYQFSPSGDRTENLETAIGYYQEALSVFSECNASVNSGITLFNLGNAYFSLPIGNRKANLEASINCFNQALRLISEDVFPKERGAILNSLGQAYHRLPQGDPTNNLQTAIMYFKDALRLLTEKTSPSEWAMTMNSLGNAYRALPSGDKTSNLSNALECYHYASRVLTEKNVPSRWATVRHNIGVASQDLRIGDYGRNLEVAITCFEDALRVHTEQAFPVEWAGTINSLGLAYMKLPTGDRGTNLVMAIHCFESALRIHAKDNFPVEWAATMHHLGMAYSELPTGDRKTNLDLATEYYEHALLVRTKETFPVAWAETLNSLGIIYNERETGDQADNLQKAVTYFTEALSVRDEASFPEEWAGTLSNLAMALIELPTGDRNEHFRKALEYVRASLGVYTEKRFPTEWAKATNNLGRLYLELSTGNRATNLQMAIGHLNDALRVYTKAEYPREWADAMSNLGIAYRELPVRDRSDNLDIALNYFHEALLIYSKDNNPDRYVTLLNHLGLVYFELQSGSIADNLEKAINCYTDALECCTRNGISRAVPDIAVNLANAYQRLPMGDRTDNLHTAIRYYEVALKTYTEESFPERWAAVRNNLGSVYLNLPTGERSKNLKAALDCFSDAIRVHTEQDYPFDWAMTMANLGNVYANLPLDDSGENRNIAIDCYKRALLVLTADAAPFEAMDTLNNLALVQSRGAIWEGLFETSQLAIENLRRLREGATTDLERRRLLSRYAKFFDWGVTSAVATKRISDGLLIAEAGKTRSMVELLNRCDVKPANITDVKWNIYLKQLQEVRAWEQRLSAYSWQNDESGKYRREIRENLLFLRKLLAKSEAEFGSMDPNYLPTMPPMGFDEVQRICGELGATIVEFRVTEIGTFIFLLNQDDDEIYERQLVLQHFTTTTLDEMLNQIDGEQIGWMTKYRLTQDTDLATEEQERRWREWMSCMDQTMGQLYTELLAPVHQRLKELYPTAKRVVLVPNKGLNLLPLHAAHYDFEGQRRCLLDDYEILYAPSCAVLQRNIKWDGERSERSHLFAVQNPSVKDPDRNLPFSDWEVPEIGHHFPSKEILPGDQATLNKTKDGIVKGNEIFLSCHATYDADDPNNSHLLLANGDKLTFEDILKLDLSNTWLVVLSACETAMSDVRDRVDEVLGLHTAFLLARAPTVVGSLWSVNDFSTALLMTRFHNNLYQRQMGKAAALREAQLWLRDLPEDEAKTLIESKKAELTRERLSKSDLVMPYREIGELAKEYNGKPFSHPYFWAAFQCMGAG